MSYVKIYLAKHLVWFCFFCWGFIFKITYLFCCRALIFKLHIFFGKCFFILLNFFIRGNIFGFICLIPSIVEYILLLLNNKTETILEIIIYLSKKCFFFKSYIHFHSRLKNKIFLEVCKMCFNDRVISIWLIDDLCYQHTKIVL